MNRSEQINELVAALAKAQAEMKDAALNKVNPHFKNRYADLPAVRDAVTGPLSKNGLSAFQTMSEADGKTFLETTLAHASGQWIQSVTPILVDKPGMQALGSGITYARRYALAAICGIASDEDDDGEGAEGRAKTKTSDRLVGPLTITDLKKRMRAFSGDLAACTDEGMLAGLLMDYDLVLKQCQRDLPEWWLGSEDAKGAEKAIADKRAEIGQ